MEHSIIPIFYACDDNFVKYTVVSLHSMIKNADPTKRYHVHVLHTDIKPETMKSVTDLSTEAFEITFDDVTEYLESISDKLTKDHMVTIVAIIAVVAVQVLSESLALSALCGVLVMILGGAIPWKKVDESFASGIHLMGMIAMIMLVAGGYAEVMKATESVNALVEAAITVMGGSKWIAAVVITLIGLLVTMGIGSSFSTVPVLAVLYVPLCSRMGFSPAATILLMSAAAALGDAGSPASDTTLGPTSGLNADGQHDHIWDTCVPTFIHFNIPLMVVSIVVSQFI